jgi:Carboxypeptidase regulatory-like domain
MSRSLFSALAALAFACCALGQNANGVLDGRVTDSSGAAVPGAKVTIENQGTGTRQEFTTNSEGRFYQGQVLIGTYRVTVENAGFQKYVQSLPPPLHTTNEHEM